MLAAGAPDISCMAATLVPPISPTAPPPLYRLTLGILEYWRHLARKTDINRSPAAKNMIAINANTADVTDSTTCSQCQSTGTLLLDTNDGGGDMLKACPCGARLACRYSLLRCIGRGAFSHVYLIRDHWRQLQWAMKVLGHPFERLAIREVALLLGPLSALPSAPHCQGGLIRLSDGRVALLLEHLTPITQGWMMSDRPPWQLLLADCARCLASLHSCGLLHGDIKPENIMCVEVRATRPRFKLIDYGNCMSQEELLAYYGDSGQVASLRYRAPEALVGLRSELGTALDIWSLGVSLAQLLAREAGRGQKQGQRWKQEWDEDCEYQDRDQDDPKFPPMPPLFLGSTEREMLEEIIEIGGPLPDHFSRGTRWEALGKPALRSACDQGSTSFWQRWARSNWARLLGIQDGLLLDVLMGMLQMDPAARFTAQDILQHPYLW